MFKYNTNMLLENAPIIGSTVSRTALNNESYFNAALTAVEKIKSQLNEAKLELYQGISEASSTDDFKKYFSKAYETSFPKKQDLAVRESCDSTEHFIRYFGNAVKILNTAAGNIAGSCDTICNQAPVIAKESAKLISAVKEAKDNPVCPVCGKLPCTCSTNSERLFKFDTSTGFDVKKIDFQGIGQSIFDGEGAKVACDKVKTENASLRAELCRLKDITISEAEFGDAIIESMRTVVREDVQINKKYLDYCTETVLNFESKIYGVKSEAAKIARVFREATDGVEKIMYSNSTGQLETDAMKKPLSEEETQELDLYCKAKVDETISQCNTYLIAIAAKLDAIKSEYDQCKAVLAKYICNQDQPIALPAPSSPVDPGDGVVAGQEPITEKPAKESKEEDDDFDEYGSVRESALFNRGGECSYAEAYESFLIDTIIKEAELTNYINATLMTEDTQLAINEGLLASAKGGIKKIMEFLKTIWGKFTNAMASVFQNDQKYLGENKNIIMGNKPKNVNIENWYNYDIDRINEGKIGSIGSELYSFTASSGMVSTMATGYNKGVLNDAVKKCSDKENGVANAFNMFFGSEYDSKSANTADKFKDYFRGVPVTVSASSFTTQDMQKFYDYCYNFKSSTLNVIEGEKNKINEMYQKAMDSINALDNKVTAEKKAGGSAGEEKSDGAENVKKPAGGDAGGEKTEGADLAAAMDMYFSEVNITSTPGNAAPSQDNPTKSQINNDQHDEKMKSMQDVDSEMRDKAATEATDEMIKALKTYYDNVFGLVKDYTAARLTCAQGAYHDYMKLFRWHVGQYKGTANADSQQGTVVDTAAAKAQDDQSKI